MLAKRILLPKINWGIILIFTVALLIRLIIAPIGGHSYDLNCFQNWWKEAMFNKNLSDLYYNLPSPGYPILPLILYMFKFTGFIYRLFISQEIIFNTPSVLIFLKLPAIVFDLLTGLLILRISQKYWKPRTAILLTIIFLFHPAVVYISAYWGQFDIIAVFFLLLAFHFLNNNNFLYGWIVMVLAILSKIQSIFFVPLICVINLLHKEKLISYLRNLVFIIFSFLLICFPFIRNFNQIIQLFIQAPSTHSILSIQAFNFWWLFRFYNKMDIIEPISDREPFLGEISYLQVGLIIFVLFYFLIIVALRNNFSERNVYLSASLITLNFFLFLTQMHERYLFPLIIFLLIITPRGQLYKLIYLIFSLTYFLNLITIPPYQGLLIKILKVSPYIVLVNIVCFFVLLIFFISKRNKREITPNLLKVM